MIQHNRFKSAVLMDAGPRAEAEPRFAQVLADAGYILPSL